MFSSENFIATYLDSDIIIRMLDVNGLTSFSFSVCNYLSEVLIESKIKISLKSIPRPYELIFASNQDAALALNKLKNTISVLKNNCKSPQLQTNNPTAFVQGENLIKIWIKKEGNSTILNWEFEEESLYEISYNIHGDFFSTKKIKNISGGSYTFTNLLNSEVYEFNVRKKV